MNGNGSSLQREDGRTGRHSIVLEGRTALTVTGVTDVTAFDESCVCLDTVCGLLDIEGEGLSVKDLSLSEGKLCVAGKVNGAWYTEKKQKGEKNGFFAFRKR